MYNERVSGYLFQVVSGLTELVGNVSGGEFTDRPGGYMFQVMSVLTDLVGTCFR